MAETASGENVSVEEDIFLTIVSVRKNLIRITIAGLTVGFVAVIAAIVIVAYGKGKDKIIIMDASGRPTLLKVDTPDRINPPELEVFLRETLPMTLDWDYAEAQDQSMGDRHMRSIAPRFDGKFITAFYRPLRDIYLASIISQRSVVRNTVADLGDLQFEGGDKAAVKLTVRTTTFKVGDQQATGESTADKQYVIKVRKGARTLENPYGIYIYYLTEYHG